MNNEKKPMTASEKTEWLAIRKEAGLKIDPETAEVDWTYGLDLDPYDLYELPEEYSRSGVSIGHVLPEAIFGFISEICRMTSTKSFGQSIARGSLSPRA